MKVLRDSPSILPSAAAKLAIGASVGGQWCLPLRRREYRVGADIPSTSPGNDRGYSFNVSSRVALEMAFIGQRSQQRYVDGAEFLDDERTDAKHVG